MKFVINLLMLVLAISAKAETVLRFQPQINTDAHVLGDVLIISEKKIGSVDNWSSDVPRLVRGIQLDLNKGKKPLFCAKFLDTANKSRHVGRLKTNCQQTLAALPLDSELQAGQLIHKKQLIAWIKQQTKDLSYLWKGKNSALIRSKQQTSGIALVAKAKTALSHYLSQYHYDSIELISKNTPKAEQLPLSSFTAKIISSYPPAKQVCVRLQHDKKSIPLWFKVKAYQKVLVAKKTMKKASIVHQNDFVLKKLNIAGLGHKPSAQLSKASWLKKSINKDHILTDDDLSPVPDVTKGETIRIKIVNQGISITTEAIAQENGYKGQKVLMKNISSKQSFMAKVIALNQAEVSE